MVLIEVNKGFDKDFKLSIEDEEERLVAGWASVEVIDKQGQYIDIETLSKAMFKFMDRGGFINYGHENKPVGKVLYWQPKIHPETGKYGIWIVAKINRGYKLDDIVWNMIKSGKLKGFSIAGLGNLEKKIMKADNGEEREVEVLKDIELTEISLVDEPANPYARIEQISFAKGTVKEIVKSDFVQGLLDELWEKIDDKLKEYNVSKSFVIADEIIDEVEKSFEKYIEFLKSNIVKAEGMVSTESEGMDNPVYGDELIKPKKKEEPKEAEEVEKENDDEDKKKEDKTPEVNEEMANEEAKKDGRIILKDLEGLERLEILKSEDKYIVKDLKTGNEFELFEKELVQFQKPEDLRPPKEWWDRCIEETGRPALCGWVYYHHLKPEPPEGKKDKPHTRKARERKKKWLKEKNAGEIGIKIKDLRKRVSELKKVVPVMSENIVEVQKPFAGFKDWDDCIKKMKESGYDEESAKRICGKLKAEYEKALIKKGIKRAKIIVKSVELKKKVEEMKGE